jgi:hypothetical protein
MVQEYDDNLGVTPVDEKPVDVDVEGNWRKRRKRQTLFRVGVLAAGCVAAGAFLDYSGVVDFSEKYNSTVQTVQGYFASEPAIPVEVVPVVEQVPVVDSLPFTEFRKGDIEIYPGDDNFELRLKTDEGCRIFYSNGNDLREGHLGVNMLESYVGKCFSDDRYVFDFEADRGIYSQATDALDVLLTNIEISYKVGLETEICADIGKVANCGSSLAYTTEGNSSYKGLKNDAKLVFGSYEGKLPSGAVVDLGTERVTVTFEGRKGTVSTQFSLGLGHRVNDLNLLYTSSGKVLLSTSSDPEDKFAFYQDEVAFEVGKNFALSTLSELEDLAVKERQRIQEERARLVAVESARVQEHKEAVLGEFSSILGE